MWFTYLEVYAYRTCALKQHYVILWIRISLEENMGMRVWIRGVRVRAHYLRYLYEVDSRNYIVFCYRSYRFYSSIIDYPLYHCLHLIFLLRIFGLS